jgi:hypothetical protein
MVCRMVYLGTGVLPPQLKLPGEGEELGGRHEAVAGVLSQVVHVLHHRQSYICNSHTTKKSYIVKGSVGDP